MSENNTLQSPNSSTQLNASTITDPGGGGPGGGGGGSTIPPSTTKYIQVKGQLSTSVGEGNTAIHLEWTEYIQGDITTYHNEIMKKLTAQELPK